MIKMSVGTETTQNRKLIAVILSKPSKLYQTGLLQGIYKVAFENDCNVLVFGTTHPRSDRLYHKGELSIYRMINYEKLDGVIYIPGTILYDERDKTVTADFLKAVREKNIPAVTIDLKYDGIPCFNCDETAVVKEMVSHLIEVHGCKDIAYLTGKKGHPHSTARLNGFREAMNEHGLEIQSNRIFWGDFWYTSGEPFCDFITSAPNGLPDGIVCACGPMGESVYKGLQKRGIRVPRDLKLASLEEFVSRAPFISSTNRRTVPVGKAVCEGLIKLMNGGSIPGLTKVSCEIIKNYRLTCGCVEADDYNILSLCGEDADRGEIYFSEYNTMKETLTSKVDADEMMSCIDEYSYYLKDYKGLYFCMCDGWNDPMHSPDESQKATEFTSEMVLYYKHCSNSRDAVLRKIGDQERFSIKEMFPPSGFIKDHPAAYVLRSLHFKDRVFGYAAISFGDELKTPCEDFDYWLNDISTSIESVRRLSNARYLYKKVQIDAVTDGMTGLYNRNGFNSMFSGMLDRAAKSGLDTAVILGDLNGLKHVNDTFGHAAGDEIIKVAAGAIGECTVPGTVCENNFRIGGDEFVKVAYGHFTSNDIEDFQSSLDLYLKNYNNKANKSYAIYVPIGIKVCRAGEPHDPDAVLSEADKLMYIEKMRIKKDLGIEPNDRI